MYRNNKKGFTLIELLVVIAIIGILSAVVLASLNTARQRGADAAIKSSINNARAQASLYYEDNESSYDGVCEADSDGGIYQFLAAAEEQAGENNVVCNDDEDDWAMSALLRSPSDTTYYCVDSAGASREVGTALGTDVTVCPTS